MRRDKEGMGRNGGDSRQFTVLITLTVFFSPLIYLLLWFLGVLCEGEHYLELS